MPPVQSFTVNTRHVCPSHGAESPSYPQCSTRTAFHFIPRIPTSSPPWTLQSWPHSRHRSTDIYPSYLDLFQVIGQSLSILLDLFKVIGQSPYHHEIDFLPPASYRTAYSAVPFWLHLSTLCCSWGLYWLEFRIISSSIWNFIYETILACFVILIKRKLLSFPRFFPFSVIFAAVLINASPSFFF